MISSRVSGVKSGKIGNMEGKRKEKLLAQDNSGSMRVSRAS